MTNCDHLHFNITSRGVPIKDIAVFVSHLQHKCLCLCVFVYVGVRQTPVMSASTRVRPILSETGGGPTTASYATVCPTLQCSVLPIVHTLSLDAHR